MDDNAGLHHYCCNLLRVSRVDGSWSGFISMLMPGGGMFALMPACYHFALYFMLLSLSQQALDH